MRVMAYIGSVLPLLALWGLWLWRRKKLETSRVFLWVATWAVVTPFVMNTAGWLLTENGRQPWIVQGLLLTEDGNSPSVSTTEVAISLGVFWLLYLALGVVWVVPDAALRAARPRARARRPRRARRSGSSAPRAPALTY